MNEEELKNFEDYLKSLPTIKQNMSIPVTTNIGLNLDDLMSAVKSFKKVPTYDDLLRENQQLKEEIEKLKKELYTTNMTEEEVLEREHLKRKAEER